MDAQLEKARVLVELGRPEAAEEILSALLAGEPDNAEALATLANIRYGARDYERAIELSEHALRLRPEYEYPWRIKALAESQLGVRATEPARVRFRRERALSAARRCVALDIENAENHRILALVTMHVDPAEASRILAVALELDPENADLHTLRASVLRMDHHNASADAEAATALWEALRLAPEHVDAMLELAYIDLDAGRRATAMRRLRRVAALDMTKAPMVRALLSEIRSGREYGSARVGEGSSRSRTRWPWVAAVVGVLFIARLVTGLSGAEGDDPGSRTPTRTTYRLPPDYRPPSMPVLPPDFSIPQMPRDRLPPQFTVPAPRTARPPN